MKKISKPDLKYSAKEIYQICIEQYSNEDKRKKYSVYKKKIEAALAEYDKYITKNFDAFLNQNASVEETGNLIELYNYIFVKKRTGGFYDKIKASVDICPICGEGSVKNLDHFLPKTKYPFLVVMPENLIPSCRDCNMEKRNIVPTCNEDVTFHPYYDEINVVWLEASIDYSETDSFKIKFVNGINKLEEPLLGKRVDAHMDAHKLNQKFSVHAISDVNSKKRNHKRTLECGRDALKRDLEDELESYEAEDINSWRSALYRELVRNIEKYSEWLSSINI